MVWNLYTNSGLDKHRGTVGNQTVNKVTQDKSKPSDLAKTANSQNTTKSSCDKCKKLGHTIEKCMSRKPCLHCTDNRPWHLEYKCWTNKPELVPPYMRGAMERKKTVNQVRADDFNVIDQLNALPLGEVTNLGQETP